MHGQIDEDNDKDGEDNDDLKGRRKDSSVAIMEALMRTALGLVRKKICVVSSSHFRTILTQLVLENSQSNKKHFNWFEF